MVHEGWPTVEEQLAEHPSASVTVTLYVPAVNPEIDDVVAPLLHKYE